MRNVNVQITQINPDGSVVTLNRKIDSIPFVIQRIVNMMPREKIAKGEVELRDGTQYIVKRL